MNRRVLHPGGVKFSGYADAQIIFLKLPPHRGPGARRVDQPGAVGKRTAERYLYAILREFKELTGVPALINTFFNLRGEQIVSSPADALKTFYTPGIDCRAIEDFLVEKP